MLVLLCKDFYCYLLEISLPQQPFIIPPWTSCLELEKLLQFSHIRDFFFFPLLLPLLSIKQRKWVLFIFCPSYWTVNFKKIPLQKIHSCSWRFSGTSSLISWLESLLLKLLENGSLSLKKFDNIFTTAVLFVAVSPSALSVLWKKKKKGTKNV